MDPSPLKQRGAVVPRGRDVLRRFLLEWPLLSTFRLKSLPLSRFLKWPPLSIFLLKWPTTGTFLKLMPLKQRGALVPRRRDILCGPLLSRCVLKWPPLSRFLLKWTPRYLSGHPCAEVDTNQTVRRSRAAWSRPSARASLGMAF